MDKGIVINTEDKWQGHPDVAIFHSIENGMADYIYVAYRESDHHKTNENTSIKVVCAPVEGDGFVFSEPITLFYSESDGRYNCPRLSVIDGRLYCIADYVRNDSTDFIAAENTEGNTEVHFLWTVDGETWMTPREFPGVTGIVPDRLQFYNGSFVLATHMARGSVIRHLDGRLVQDIWINSSDDPGSDNWEKHLLAGDMLHNLCEASVFEINDKHLGCLMRENSQRGIPAFYCRSQDGGKSWSKHKPTRLFGCHRPVMNRLKSGNFFVTYREQSSTFAKRCWARNTFSAIVFPTDDGYPNFSAINILPLDHDRSSKPDGGYTGWVQLPDESIFIVNYITDDSIKPQIRYYVVKEDEYYDKNLIGDFF